MCIASFYTTEAGSSPCLHNIQGSKGIIPSPRCDTITNCSWLITVSNNHSVFLTFTTFELYYKGEDNLHKKTSTEPRLESSMVQSDRFPRDQAVAIFSFGLQWSRMFFFVTIKDLTYLPLQ